ncbi:DUF2771 family protein [Amycolatopsis suaedae]|uniref:DUF2771 family protein n=1 Tax=Amycolatopsis suaedae TaxID=2510978 RepID=A0A4V2ELJ9_9PSEU|nr:DUF2771 family protein [Amycolatopsis suaedae]RZQ61825.1 DUF2771 family protein [Amycolatopsis suaedae]
MRRKFPGLLLAAAGVVTLAGCGGPVGPPEVTFFADGETAVTGPFQFCGAQMQDCRVDENAAARLKVRPGKPVQVSLPSEIVETPWVAHIQAVDPAGRPLPIEPQFYPQNSRHAITASAGPADQIMVVEIQQLTGTVDPDGNIVVDVRARWTLQIEPA